MMSFLTRLNLTLPKCTITMKHFMNVYDEHYDTDVYVCPMTDLYVYL